MSLPVRRLDFDRSAPAGVCGRIDAGGVEVVVRGPAMAAGAGAWVI